MKRAGLVLALCDKLQDSKSLSDALLQVIRSPALILMYSGGYAVKDSKVYPKQAQAIGRYIVIGRMYSLASVTKEMSNQIIST